LLAVPFSRSNVPTARPDSGGDISPIRALRPPCVRAAREPHGRAV
jgi:hypothetical protein